MNTSGPPAKRGRAPASFRGSNFAAKHHPTYNQSAAAAQHQESNFAPDGNNDNSNHTYRHKPAGGQRAGRAPTTGARLFIGNLHSESTSKEELMEIFSVYGEVIDVAIHKAFGFVHFAREQDLETAMEAEQGRRIGGRAVDLQRAKSDFAPNQSHPNATREGRDTYGSSGNRYGAGAGKFHAPPATRPGGGSRQIFNRTLNMDNINAEPNPNYFTVDPSSNLHNGVKEPLNGKVLRVILLGEQQRSFAEGAVEDLDRIGIPLEIEMLDGRTLSQALRDSEKNRCRYVLIVGRENIDRRNITVKLLHLQDPDTRKCPTFDLTVDQLVKLVISEEKKLGFLQDAPTQPHHIQHLPPPQNPSPALSNLLQSQTPSVNINEQVNLVTLQQQLAALTQQIATIASVATQNALPVPSQNLASALTFRPAVNSASSQDEENRRLHFQLKQQEEILAKQLEALREKESKENRLRQTVSTSSYSKPQTQDKPGGATADQLAALSSLLNSIQAKK